MKTSSSIPKLLLSPYFLVVITPFVLLAPVYLTGRAIFWGTPYLQFVPWWYRALEMLQQGVLPLWDPLVGMGAPLVANYQSALFYPPDWLYLLAGWIRGIEGIAWMQAVLIAAHLAWAGVGMVQFTRRLQLTPLAQLTAGLSFGLSGYLVARSGFLSINAAVSWTPWILWGAAHLSSAVEEIVLSTGGSRDPRRFQKLFETVLGVGVLIGMQLLAGHAQVSWYTLVLAGLWLTFMGRGKVLIRWFGFAASGVIGAVLAMVQLLPTFEYLSQSQRSGAVDFEFAMNYSYSPWRLTGLIAPDLFGNPAKSGFWGYGNYWEDAVYIGLLGFVFALTALLRWRENRQMVVFLFAVSVGTMFLAFGQNTPIFPWLYEHVPTFDMFQAPARWSLLTVWSLATLGSLGVDGWKKPVGRKVYFLRLGTAGAGAVTIGAAAGWFLLHGDSEAEQLFGMVKALGSMGLLAALTGVLLLLTPEESTKLSRWKIALVSVMVVDLLAANWGLLPGIVVELYRPQLENKASLDEILGEGRLYLPPEEERKLKFEAYFNFETFTSSNDWMDLPEALLPNTFANVGIASVNNFDPLVPARYSVWMENLTTQSDAVREKMLNLMAVSVVEKEDLSQPYGVRFERIQTDPAALRWSGCVRTAKNEQDALVLTLSPEISTDVLVLESEQEISSFNCNETAAASLILLDQKPGELVVKTSALNPGWLFWSEVWYPGWRAYVDGEQKAVMRANYLFRAVGVQPGEHIIRVSYEPASFRIGAGISVVTWAAGILLWYVHKRTRASHENT